MKIKWLVTGKTDDKCIAALTKKYLDRLHRWVKIDYMELPDIKQTRNMPPEIRKEKEGQMLLKYIRPGDYVILLDEKGKEYTSEQWAGRLEKLTLHTSGSLCFLTGGAYGFSEAVYRRANEKLALSRFTFSHQLVRVIFAEQLYRAISIIKGFPYHNP